MTDKPATPGDDRILVVDDDEFVCNSLKWLLLDEGYDVEVAPDGKKALELLSKRTYDLVLTDLMMPEVDGLAVLRRSKEVSPNTAVIILTGYGTLEAAMSALNQGAYDFLTKPCDDGEMRYKIQGALEQKRLKERLGKLESVAEKIAITEELLTQFAEYLGNEIERMARSSGEELKTSLVALKRRFDEIREAFGSLSGDDQSRDDTGVG